MYFCETPIKAFFRQTSETQRTNDFFFSIRISDTYFFFFFFLKNIEIEFVRSFGEKKFSSKRREHFFFLWKTMKIENFVRKEKSAR